MANSLGLLAQTSSLVDAQRFLVEWWDARSLPEEARFTFELAVEELFVNIATHGQAALDRDVNVELQLEWLGTPDNKVILKLWKFFFFLDLTHHQPKYLEPLK